MQIKIIEEKINFLSAMVGFHFVGKVGDDVMFRMFK